ncbi:MAG: glycosyltransferase [Aureliella sp.]
MLDAIVTAPGSLGDVNPMIAIARGLQGRGHSVVVATAERYVPLVERAGLTARVLVPEEFFARFVNDPRLWHPRKGLDIVFGPAGQAFMEEHYRWLESLVQPGRTILVSHLLDFAGRIYRDAHPESFFCSVVPAPAALRSLDQPPQLTRLGWETKLPAALVALGYRYGDRVIDRLIAGAINRLRHDVGLPPVHRILDRWWLSPDLTLGLFPDWFSIPAADLPQSLRCVGFPLADSGDLLSEAADRLVDDALRPLAGARPIVFAPGSAHAHAREFLAAGAEACRRLGLPGVLLSSVSEQFPRDLPPGVVTANYLPFRQLFRRALAIVHHGGIGTTSQALAAGLPQIVAPMAFDQFDNAARVARLGCGRTLAMVRVTASRLARHLAGVLGDAGLKSRADQVAARLAQQPVTPDDLAKVILEQRDAQRQSGR